MPDILACLRGPFTGRDVFDTRRIEVADLLDRARNSAPPPLARIARPTPERRGA